MKKTVANIPRSKSKFTRRFRRKHKYTIAVAMERMWAWGFLKHRPTREDIAQLGLNSPILWKNWNAIYDMTLRQDEVRRHGVAHIERMPWWLNTPLELGADSSTSSRTGE